MTVKQVYLLIFTAIFTLLLFLFSSILQPFYIAALLAYLSNPLVNRLQRLKLPRIFAVAIVFLLILSLLTLLGLFLIPLLIDQVNLLIRKLPILIGWLQNTLFPWLNTKLGNVMAINREVINRAVMEGIKGHQDMIAKIFTTITSSGFTIVGILFQLILIPVVTFYLLRDWNKLLGNCRRILPRSIEPTVVVLVKRYNEVLRAFIRGQLLVIIILGIIYTLGLWIVGVQFAALIGIISGLLNIVPYLGFTIGLISGLLAAYFQFHQMSGLIAVLVVFLIGQSIESLLLTPLLVGDSIGLHPVAVIFAVLTGGYFFGLIGALIALPVAAAIMVLMRYGLQNYYKSSLYS